MTTHEIYKWISLEISEIANASGSNLSKAQVMSELVYESIDHLKTLTLSEQDETIRGIIEWIDGTEPEGVTLIINDTDRSLLMSVLRAIVDKANVEP